MIGTSRAKQASGPELWTLDEARDRYAVVVDGRVTWCGSRGECQRRLAILAQPNVSRDRQDELLHRALR